MASPVEFQVRKIEKQRGVERASQGFFFFTALH